MKDLRIQTWAGRDGACGCSRQRQLPAIQRGLEMKDARVEMWAGGGMGRAGAAGNVSFLPSLRHGIKAEQVHFRPVEEATKS